MKFIVVSAIVLLALEVRGGVTKCEKTITTASGFKAPNEKKLCSGDLIFEDTFEHFDLDIWQHELTLGGSSSWEFQWYTNNRSNSFVEDGNLNIRTTLTSDDFGERFLYKDTLNLYGSLAAEQCTNAAYLGCERTGSHDVILNPIKSARVKTLNSFSFKYGKVEISAKMPAGDWLWPSIKFSPKNNAYGNWPASGEIDLVESRGNRELVKGKINIGTDQISSTLHYGPYAAADGYQVTTFPRNSNDNGKGFNSGFHRYQMEWTAEKITFSVDDIETATVKGKGGFWEKGQFESKYPGTWNPWVGAKMAPFDQEFYMTINLAVGGLNYFPDDAVNAVSDKPWKNDSPTAVTEFWHAKNDWLPSWRMNENRTKEASLLVDYIRVWAL